jgi:hypothetical protein
MIKEVELLGIEVIFREKINKSYEKNVKVIKDGITYLVILNYDDWDGYSIYWSDENSIRIDEPDWAVEYINKNSNHDLAYLLDEMGVEND